MTYFEDLSLYEYCKGSERADLPVLNIGWLDKSEPFPSGVTGQKFQERLFSYCLDKNVVYITRGFHFCNLCGQSGIEWAQNRQNYYGDGSKCMSLGFGEIRIIGNSSIYAAPTLIYHYVNEHSYLPPDEFINAVLYGPKPESSEYREFLRTHQNNY